MLLYKLQVNQQSTSLAFSDVIQHADRLAVHMQWNRQDQGYQIDSLNAEIGQVLTPLVAIGQCYSINYM
jgi:hypothetical protein